MCGGFISVFLHVIDSYNDTENLHNGFLYFDTPIKDYAYTWNNKAANYKDKESCCYGWKNVFNHKSSSAIPNEMV